MIFYFSATGNSKWIARQLSTAQQEELFSIPELLGNGMLEFSLKEEEKVGFVFPVYSWAPPEIVLHFIEQLTFRGYKGQYMFFVCSCGDDTGLTQHVFTAALRRKGWECHAGFSVIMPNTYVLLPGFDTDKDDLERKKLAESVLTMKRVNEQLGAEKRLFACYKGSFPFVKTRVIQPLFVRFQMSPKHFRVTEDCVGCRRCESHCPMGNVSVLDGKPTWGSNCISCFACYHVCPRHAVQYGKRTGGKGQYVHPDFE